MTDRMYHLSKSVKLMGTNVIETDVDTGERRIIAVIRKLDGEYMSRVDLETADRRELEVDKRFTGETEQEVFAQIVEELS
ncbi:hypothetical protein ES705_07285 [subsurface metagenome]